MGVEAVRSMQERDRTAVTKIDFDRTGKQVGSVMIPDSLQDDAWGVTWAPIAVVANSAGTAVTIEGGNHGDEYESPIPSHKGASVKPPTITCKSPPLAIKHIA